MSSMRNVLGKLHIPRSGHNSPIQSDNEGTPRPGRSESPHPHKKETMSPDSATTGDSSNAALPNRAGTSLSSLSGLSNGLSGKRSSTDVPSSKRHSIDIFHRGSKDGSAGHRTSTPMGALRKKLGRSNSESSQSSTENLAALRGEGEALSKNQLRKHEKQVEKDKHRKEAEEKREAERKNREEMERKAAEAETEEQKTKYGTLPINNYAGPNKELTGRTNIRELTANQVGQNVIFRARIHNVRKLSSKLMFIELRQQTATIQGILHEGGSVSQYFLYWAEHLHIETIVLVKGRVQEPKAKQGEVIGVTIHNIEIQIEEMHVEGTPTEPLPFTVHEAEVTKAETEQEGDTRHRVSDRARWNNRIIDLRTTASQSIFRIQSGICQAFRSHLHSLGFLEIHTPKLQGAASESGASVFKVDYFGRPAFLAQSPQLGKQMSIAADLRRVFEIGPVFRAENSNTHRHLTEFTGLDLEMAIDEHYHEVLRVLDSTFKAIFTSIYTDYRHEVDIVKTQYPHEDLVWLDQTPIIPFAEAVQMLNDSGHRDEHGKELPLDEDLGTRDEIALGAVIKDKLKTDYYVLDKFPASARPFYAMPDPENPNITNSFDIFLRGQEILSGGQRIHDANMLAAKMEALKMDPTTMEEYMTGFEWGAPPHGGGGIGMERILMLLLKLGDIRNASLYPRDPRSLPYTPPVKQLRHPEASTLHPPWSGQDRVAAGMDYQPLEKLIANYGDASNTSWLEPKFEIWRDPNTGAAIGFVPHQGFAITIGDPLCHVSQYTKIANGYIRYIKKERHIKPLWVLCGTAMEGVLAEKFDWRTFSPAAEQRLDPGNNPAIKDPDIQRKIRHAEKEGVKIHDIPLGTPVPDDVREKIDKRVEDWLKGRKGKQVHLTDVHPWQDTAHRQYHYSTTPDGTIAGLVIMAQLSPEHGWQVKFSLDFPGAPSGAIEALVMHSLKAAATGGATSVTFGGGASSKLTPGRNLKGTRFKVLNKAYTAIAAELKLTNKTEFRTKMGAKDDPIFVCYPPHGLGPAGARAVISFFEDDEETNQV